MRYLGDAEIQRGGEVRHETIRTAEWDAVIALKQPNTLEIWATGADPLRLADVLEDLARDLRQLDGQ